jgi:hypothetical protein
MPEHRIPKLCRRAAGGQAKGLIAISDRLGINIDANRLRPRARWDARLDGHAQR